MNICIIDGNKISDRELLHTILAQSLNFPEWYGKNLDALYDCLTDIQEETEIQLINEKSLTDHLGNYARGFFKVLIQASQINSKIHWKIYDS